MKSKRIFSVIICVLLVISTAACKKKGETFSSSDYEYITSEYNVTEVVDGEDGNSQADSKSGNADKNNSGSGSSVYNPNRVQPAGSKGSIDESKFKGKHLKLMIKFDPKSDEDIVKGYMEGLNSWMKKYNCTYEIVASDQYNEKLKASIAAKDAPDLFYQIFAAITSPIPEQVTCFMPSDMISPVRYPSVSTFCTAASTASASLSISREKRSIIAAERMVAIGFALSCPAISGAEPWLGS